MLTQLYEFKIFISIFVFIAGMCVGSFLNVCIFRIPNKQSIVFPHSSCLGCNSRIRSVDLIPVISYIMLKGKCRNCHEPISIQYPLIEAFTGLLWLFAFLRYGFTFETIAVLFLFSLLVPVAVIDLKHMIIPNGLVITGLIGGAGVFAFHVFVRPISFYQTYLWYAPLLGMISASGILFIIALIGFLIYRNDGAMGMGDVKIFLPIGLILGLKLALTTLVLSVIICAIVSIVLMLFKVVNRKSAIPFGPFIVLGTFIAGLLAGHIL